MIGAVPDQALSTWGVREGRQEVQGMVVERVAAQDLNHHRIGAARLVSGRFLGKVAKSSPVVRLSWEHLGMVPPM